MLTVYTAIIGKHRDIVRPPLIALPPATDVEFVVYSDRQLRVPAPWQLRPPAWQHDYSDCRTARWHKLNSHLLFPASRCTLWMDGSHQLAVDPRAIVDKHGDGDPAAGFGFATFRHPQRSSVYEELKACVWLRKDDRAVMQAQMARYRAEGYSDYQLHETSCILRQRCEDVSRLDSFWWAEMVRGSKRDQLSLDYSVWRTGLQRCLGLLPGCREQSPYFIFHKHR